VEALSRVSGALEEKNRLIRGRRISEVRWPVAREMRSAIGKAKGYSSGGESRRWRCRTVSSFWKTLTGGHGRKTISSVSGTHRRASTGKKEDDFIDSSKGHRQCALETRGSFARVGDLDRRAAVCGGAINVPASSKTVLRWRVCSLLTFVTIAKKWICVDHSCRPLYTVSDAGTHTEVVLENPRTSNGDCGCTSAAIGIPEQGYEESRDRAYVSWRIRTAAVLKQWWIDCGRAAVARMCGRPGQRCACPHGLDAIIRPEAEE